MRAQVAVDTQIMRGINTSAVLSVLRAEVRMSVSELAERTGLSRQAISRSLTSLESAGLVGFIPPDATENRSGRPAQLARFRAEAGHVLGVSVTPREIRVAVADLAGHVLAQQAVAVDTQGAVSSVLSCIRVSMKICNLTVGDIWAVSVGSPGIIDPEQGLVKFLPSMSELQGDVLAREIGDELDCHVQLDNDLKLATEGEQWRGALHDVSSMVLIEWGERVGAGVVLNGSLYRGASNDAGDLGFLQLMGMSKQTAPGSQADRGLGDFESWVGGEEVVSHAARLAAENSNHDLVEALAGQNGADALDIVLTAVQAGDQSAREAVELIAGRFATGVAAIRALLDPQLIIIGGPMARCGDVLLDALQDALADQVLNQPTLELSSLGDDAVVYGAVHRALAHVEGTHFTFNTVTETVTSNARQKTNQ